MSFRAPDFMPAVSVSLTKAGARFHLPFRFITMLLRGFIRPKASWPFGPFRTRTAHVLHAAQAQLGPSAAPSAPDAGQADSSEAASFYSGRFTFAGEAVLSTPDELFRHKAASEAWRKERDSLAWLRHFSVKPRRLHVYYLARLMDGWMASSASSWNMQAETERLNNLAAVLPGLSGCAGEREKAVFRQALTLQCARVEHLKPHDPQAAVQQSLSFLHLARNSGGFAQLKEKAWAQLSSSLTQIVMADGGDAWQSPERAIALADALHDVLGENAGAPVDVLAAQDRLLAYIAMLNFGQGQWSADIAGEVPPELEGRLVGVHAISHAAQAGRTRLQQGDTCLLAHWGREFNLAFFEIALRGKPLFLIHGGEGAPAGAAKPAQYEGGLAQGEMLSMAWHGEGFGHERRIYLSADGKDIRFEDGRTGGKGPQSVWIDLPPRCKVLRSQDKAGANIYMPDGSGWQLRVRSAGISCTEAGRSLKITAFDGAGPCMQWALKKHPSARPRGGKSQKPAAQDSELPF